jgi:hypothetical protein
VPWKASPYRGRAGKLLRLFVGGNEDGGLARLELMASPKPVAMGRNDDLSLGTASKYELDEISLARPRNGPAFVNPCSRTRQQFPELASSRARSCSCCASGTYTQASRSLIQLRFGKKASSM